MSKYVKTEQGYVKKVGEVGTGLESEIFNDYADNVASGEYSHAEGLGTNAEGNGSHAEGYSTTASGENSHAEGQGTIASGITSHVQGSFNIEDTSLTYAHIVGNGISDTTRSNAHTLDWDGNAWYAGNIKVGGNSYSSSSAKTLATTEYVDIGLDSKADIIDGKILSSQLPTIEFIMPTKDKKMLIFGDGITETATMNDDGSNYVEGKRVNWMTFAKTYLDTSNFKNYAKSGATYKDTSGGTYRQNVSEQITMAMADSNNDDAEIIVMSLGTNNAGDSIGDYDTAMAKTSIDDLDRTNLYEALRWAMWTLRNKYTNATCFVGMPIQRASNEQPTAMIEAIKKMANRYNFIIIDATNESGIIREFETSGASGRYLSDGLHPNAEGSIKIAKLYSNVILRNFMIN